MTTEVWVTNFKKETLECIPDNSRLNPAQKSRLIKNLHIYFPPHPRLDYTGLSPNQFGQIHDKGNGTTCICTPSKVEIVNPNQIPKIKIRHNTWKIPETISGTSKEIANIILPGYGKRKPISLQNTSQ